jgi:hypothetical protein
VSPGATSTGTNELIVGFVAGHGNAQPITVTTPGLTVQPMVATTGTITTVVTGSGVLAATGPSSITGTFGTAMYWASGVALFRAAS